VRTGFVSGCHQVYGHQLLQVNVVRKTYTFHNLCCIKNFVEKISTFTGSHKENLYNFVIHSLFQTPPPPTRPFFSPISSGLFSLVWISKSTYTFTQFFFFPGWHLEQFWFLWLVAEKKWIHFRRVTKSLKQIACLITFYNYIIIIIIIIQL
jgi:hypothetical protein